MLAALLGAAGCASAPAPAPAPTLPAAEPRIGAAEAEDPLELVGRAGRDLEAENYGHALALLTRAVLAKAELEALEVGRLRRRLEGLLQDLNWSADEGMRPGLLERSGPSGKAAREAISAFLQGRDVEAILLASAAVGEDPQAEEGRMLLAVLSKRTGLEAPREPQLPRAALVQFKLQEAERAFFDRRYGEAARQCQEAVWLDRSNALAWTRLGSARWASGEPAKAKDAFERAHELHPDDEEISKFMRARGWAVPATREVK